MDAVDPANPVDLSRWPLVGRDEEFALARSALVTHGSVVLTGAAGVGKTRLARDLLDAVAAPADRIEWVVATQAAASVPLGPVAHLVPGLAIGRGRDATLRAIVAALARDRGAGRFLLGVDDAHRLDDASAALIHLLVSSGTAIAVVTARSGEPLADSIVAIWKDGQAPLIALQPLARGEVEQLVSDVLAGIVDGATLHFLWESSRGNALFLRELVRDGVESGALRNERGLWRWTRPLAPGARLQDLVALRMGRLDDEETAAVELLAVGEPLPAAVLERLGLGAVADRLEQRGVVVSHRRASREASLAHPLFGEVVRAAIPAGRLDALRLRLADAFDPAVGAEVAPAELLRVALWRADAGDRSRPDQLRAAARRAWGLWASRVAERLARAALEAGPDLEAGYVLGEALSDQNRPREALDAWRAAADMDGPELVRARMAVAWAGTLAYQFDQPAEAEMVLRETRDRLGDDASRTVVDGAIASIRATHFGAGALDLAELAGQLSPQAVMAVALESTGRGRFDAAVHVIDDLLASAGRWPEDFPATSVLVRMIRAWCLLLAGYADEAQREADERYQEAVRQRADYPRVNWSLMRGMVAVMRGHFRPATVALREAIAVYEHDDRGFLRPALAYLAMAAALQGDADAAAAAWAGAERARPTLDRVFGTEIARAEAWVHAARGETTTAVELAAATAARAAADGQPGWEALAVHDVARFGDARSAAPRLEALADIVDGSLVAAFSAHARGLAADDGRALDAVSTRFADPGFDLFAAEASAAAEAAHHRQGQKARAAASTRRRTELAARCDDPRTPALAWAGPPDDLTGREREVADLASAGLSSREIADRLGITTRTVDNLLGRVYVKLGVSGRRELTELLGGR